MLVSVEKGIGILYTFDPEDNFHSGCRNVRHQQQVCFNVGKFHPISQLLEVCVNV